MGSSTLFLQVTDLLGKFPDLMEEFTDFLERCENIGNLKILVLNYFPLVLSISLFLTGSIFADGFLAGVINRSMFTYLYLVVLCVCISNLFFCAPYFGCHIIAQSRLVFFRNSCEK